MALFGSLLTLSQGGWSIADPSVVLTMSGQPWSEQQGGFARAQGRAAVTLEQKWGRCGCAQPG